MTAGGTPLAPQTYVQVNSFLTPNQGTAFLPHGTQFLFLIPSSNFSLPASELFCNSTHRRAGLGMPVTSPGLPHSLDSSQCNSNKNREVPASQPLCCPPPQSPPSTQAIENKCLTREMEETLLAEAEYFGFSQEKSSFITKLGFLPQSRNQWQNTEKVLQVQTTVKNFSDE